MAENRLVEVARHWLPRMEVAGIPSATARAVMDAAGTWDNWCRAFSAEGERHAAIAEDAEAAGRTVTAGEAYVRAALLNHFAQFMFFDDLAQKDAAAGQKVALYLRAAPHLDPPAEPLAIPFEGGHLKAFRRMPEGAVGTAVLIPGSDSTKEEFGALEDHFLRRGVATVSVDGPGQGEGRNFGPLRPDVSNALAAVLAGLADTGAGDVVVVGMAFGGHLALRAAAGRHGVRGVVSINGFADLGAMCAGFPQVYRDNMVYALGAADVADAAERARGFTLAGAMPPTAPVLVIHGGRDRIFPVAEAEAQARWAGEDAQLVVLPDGNHVCNNIPWLYRPMVADWTRDRLVRA